MPFRGTTLVDHPNWVAHSAARRVTLDQGSCVSR